MIRGRKKGCKIAPNCDYKEITIEILNNDGFYPAEKNLWVSKTGLVRKVRLWEDKLYYKDLKPSITNAGYYQVATDNGRAYGVHQLVAKTFIGDCPKGKVVDHKDNDKLNNNVENLQYLTRRENCIKNPATNRPKHMIGRYNRKTSELVIGTARIAMSMEQYLEIIEEIYGKYEVTRRIKKLHL